MDLKRFLSTIFVFSSLVFMASCKSKNDSASKNYIFDPKIPGGKIGGTFVVSPIEELEADTSVPGQITLKWKISPLYTSLSYKIKIYRHRGSDPNWILPTPSASYSAADLYKIADFGQDSCPVEISTTEPPQYTHNDSQIPGNCNTWTDKGDVPGFILNEDADYKYWVYIYLKETWSEGISLVANVPRGNASFVLPSATDFWNKKVWDIGQKPSVFQGAEYQSYSTLEPKQTSCKNISNKSRSLNTLLEFSTNKTSCEGMTGCSWVEYNKSCSKKNTQSSCNLDSECYWDTNTSSCTADIYQCLPENNIGNMKGKVAFAKDGAVMYVADTDNNRVVIYTKPGILACSQYKNDPVIYDACLFQFQGYPFQVSNIIGQPNQYSNSSCNVACQNKTTSSSCSNTAGCSWSQTSSSCEPDFSYNRCLNKPNYVNVVGDQLIISDSGNNRIVVWDHLPTAGCDGEIISGQVNATDCDPKMQIGKKSFSDFNQYNFAIDGNMILNNPTGTFVDDNNNLYIADTGNHRVVKIDNFTDTQKFSCNEQNWGTQLCQFSGVLGQPSFFVRKTFDDFFKEDRSNQELCSLQSNPSPLNGGIPGGQTSCESVSVGCTWVPSQIPSQGNCKLTNTIIDNVGIGNLISSSYEWLLKRYFANPTVVKISNTGQFIVSSNENFETVSTLGTPVYLKSRILVWNTNPLSGNNASCTVGAFSSGGCDANSVIGQYNFKTLVSLQGNQSKYSEVSYGLESVDDVDIYGKYMFAVDYVNNIVYLWDNWKTSEVLGNPPKYRVLNPLGAANPSTTTNYPYLKGISSISLDRTNLLIYVTDPNNFKIYEIRPF